VEDRESDALTTDMRRMSTHILAAGRLDFDNFGARLSQHQSCERTGKQCCEVKHQDACERSHRKFSQRLAVRAAYGRGPTRSTRVPKIVAWQRPPIPLRRAGREAPERLSE